MSKVLSIIIPCYNEAGNIPAIYEKAKTITTAHPQVEVILVNNGSTDNSLILLEGFIEKYKIENIKICNVPINKGYGYGIKSGLDLATTPLLCWTHADQQTDVEDCIKALTLYQKINNETTVIKGNRINRNALDAFFTWGMQVYTNWKLKTSLHDINAQPKLFSQNFWNKIKDQAPDDFSLDIYLLYQAKKMGNIQTIDVQFLKRIHGEAKGGGSLKGKWKLIKRTFAYINQLANNI